MAPPIIPLARGGDNAIPISHIIETGEAPLSDRVGNHSTIDLSRKEASGIRALDAATAAALAAMHRDTDVLALLAKPGWDRADRVRYEERQAIAVAEAFHAQPVFADYRQTSEEAHRAPEDLTHLRPQDELDCKIMAVLKGIVTHLVEHAELAVADGSLKSPGEYYVVGGTMKLEGDGLPAGLHAALMSAKTGNMIEATWTHRPYVPAAGDYAFADYVAGRAFLSRRTGIKDGQPVDIEYQMGSLAPSTKQMLERRKAWEAGDMAALQATTEPKGITGPEFDRVIAAAHRLNDAVSHLNDAIGRSPGRAVQPGDVPPSPGDLQPAPVPRAAGEAPAR